MGFENQGLYLGMPGKTVYTYCLCAERESDRERQGEKRQTEAERDTQRWEREQANHTPTALFLCLETMSLELLDK